MSELTLDDLARIQEHLAEADGVDWYEQPVLRLAYDLEQDVRDLMQDNASLRSRLSALESQRAGDSPARYFATPEQGLAESSIDDSMYELDEMLRHLYETAAALDALAGSKMIGVISVNWHGGEPQSFEMLAPAAFRYIAQKIDRTATYDEATGEITRDPAARRVSLGMTSTDATILRQIAAHIRNGTTQAFPGDGRLFADHLDRIAGRDHDTVSDDKAQQNADAFLDHVWALCRLWERDASDAQSTAERLNGLAFSILAALDGVSEGSPSIGQIAGYRGMLHERFYGRPSGAPFRGPFWNEQHKAPGQKEPR